MKYTEKHMDPYPQKQRQMVTRTRVQKESHRKKLGPQLWRPSGTDTLNLTRRHQASPGSVAEGGQRDGTWVGRGVSFRMSPPWAQGHTWKPLAEEPAGSGSR